MARDNEARALMDQLAAASSRLRDDCGSFEFLGDDDACANSADEIDAWLASRGPRLLQQAEGGDAGARSRLVDFAHEQLRNLHMTYAEISSGITIGDVAKSVRDDAAKALPVAGGVVALIVVAVVISLVRR